MSEASRLVPSTPDTPRERAHTEPHRAIFLADGVVAIALTLLALDLKPDLPRGSSSHQLGHYLVEHGSQYFSFLLAFWLIARFWLLHHRVLTGARMLDPATMWVNILYLFTITCLPLTTSIKGNYVGGLPTTLFAGNLLAVSITVSILGELVQRHGLVAAPESPPERLVRRWRVAGSVAVPAVVVALAWVVPHAEYFFLLALGSDTPAKVAGRRRERVATDAETTDPPAQRE